MALRLAAAVLLLAAAACGADTPYEQFARALFLGADGGCDGRADTPCYWEAQPAPAPPPSPPPQPPQPPPGPPGAQLQPPAPAAVAPLLLPPRWRPSKPHLPGFRFHEYAVGEAPKKRCLARKWLYFVGDSVTRETLYALMTLNGSPPWRNFSASADVWRADTPAVPDEDVDGHCKGWQTEHTTADCFRDWTRDGVRYTFAFVGLLNDDGAPGARDALRARLDFSAPGAAQPDALFVNTGVWSMVLQRCDIAAYRHTLRALLHAVRYGGYAGTLYWLGQTRPNWGMGCFAETLDTQMRMLGFLTPGGGAAPALPPTMRIVPVDRLHLSGNVEQPQWWWRICLNATLCAAEEPHVTFHASRDGLHPTLTVQTAVAQHILNLLCPATHHGEDGNATITSA